MYIFCVVNVKVSFLCFAVEETQVVSIKMGDVDEGENKEEEEPKKIETFEIADNGESAELTQTPTCKMNSCTCILVGIYL